jgi:hypothetical protein
MAKLTRKEMDKAAAEARRKWPESFAGEYDGRPKILPADANALNASLRKMQAARTSGLPKPFRPKF